jgi:alanine racemase
MNPAAYAELDLDALHHNLKIVRQKAPKAKIMAVIKANAYGHGLPRVAAALKDVEAIAVARVDEAIRLRNSGFTSRIVVLEGFSCLDELEDILDLHLEAVIHAEHQLAFLKEVKTDKVFVAWLKLDTGMNRLGFNREGFALAYQQLQESRMIEKPLGLMTHLANADDSKNPATMRQIGDFKRAVGYLSGELSIANSAGILAWPNAITDWVRPGIMLFGVSPFPKKMADDFELRPVMSLHSRIIAIRQLSAGDTVGYGSQWCCQKPTKMGVIAIGYGDGYPRHTRPETPVLVNDIRVPLVGRVSMDMITVDLANCPDAKPGDPVLLWGPGLPIEEIADCAKTIPYTLLCGITQRVQIVEK